MNEIAVAVAILGVTGLIAGILLSVISEICKTNETNERLQKIRDCLPGANCGACGFAGCDSYAEAVDNNSADPDLCAPGGISTATELSSILGIKITPKEQTAKVFCNGCDENTGKKYIYIGPLSCKAAAALYNGPATCNYGCIGFGDCKNVCEYGAIAINKGLANVNQTKCIGCGKCIKACPKQIIKLVQKPKKSAFVLCSNTQKGADAKKACRTSCIGCGICKKRCKFDAISVNNFLASVNTEKCTACGECVAACPQEIIKIL